jgi:beta-lactamase superfamily II metal-dependent hydrolase
MGFAKNLFYFSVPVDNRVEVDAQIELDIIVPYSAGDYNNETGDNSLIVRLNYKDVTFLFTGNCGFECEKDIEYAVLDAEILKIARHGNNTATSEEFLEKVNPEVAVIWGDEKAGLPNEEVLERLEGVEIFRTDLNGTVEVVTDGISYNISYLPSETD